MKLSERTVREIASALCDRHSDVCSDYAWEYGERGYSTRHDAETPIILFGNWWRAKRDKGNLGAPDRWPRLFDQLSEQGAEFEWDDEWTISWEHDGKAFRTQPDCYGWQPSFHWTVDHDICTIDDLDYIIDDVRNSDERCINLATFNATRDLMPLGWEKFNGTFENGWYPGQNDDPKTIGPRFREAYPGHDTVWVIDGVGQFDIAFQLWHKPADEEE